MSKICYEMLENEFNTYIVSLYEPIDIIPPIYKDNDIDTAVKLSENVKVLRDTMKLSENVKVLRDTMKLS